MWWWWGVGLGVEEVVHHVRTLVWCGGDDGGCGCGQCFQPAKHLRHGYVCAGLGSRHINAMPHPPCSMLRLGLQCELPSPEQHTVILTKAGIRQVQKKAIIDIY